MSKKVLVTGGKGFIGSHLVKYLKAKGHWVRCVDIVPTSYLRTRENEFQWSDLTFMEKALSAVKGVDWVFNLAANMGGIGYITRVRADVMRDNVRINANVLEACQICDVERLFFSSSACVYPLGLQLKPQVNPLKESDAFPAFPDSAYGWEKLFTELLMQAYHDDYGLDIRIARFHNVYGPYGTWQGGREKAPAAICRKVAEAKNFVMVWGDGEQTRSFLFIDDALEAIYLLMDSKVTEPLNIGSDELISINGLVDLVAEIAGKKIAKRYDLSAPQGVRGRNADLTRIKKLLGWQPTIGYHEGLEKTYRWIAREVKK